MTLNDAQTKFISELQTMLPLYKQSSDARLKTPSTNIEWNMKKLTGQGGETLEGSAFAQRTQADLELIAAALPAGAAGQAFAVRGAGEVGSVFGDAAVGSSAVSPVAASPAGASPAATSAAAPSPSSSPGGAAEAVTDVKALLGKKADESGEKLAWKTSVVDLLKLLGKDSSQNARHKYAVALGFPEAEIANMPSSEFNTWLHGQLMSTLAHNGGNLPSNIA